MGTVEPAAATLIGVAGTVTTLAAIALGQPSYDPALIHGHALRFTELLRINEHLQRMPSAERGRVVGLHPGRAEVIVAGGIIVEEIVRWAGPRSLVASDRGVRWGLVQALGAS
jgi:exopolyphosphatase/guanosine-5'-triphosphate,3'-diphosphate pyrophosphatase